MDYDLFLYETESCEFKHLLAIDPDIFTYDIEVQESYEEVVYRMTKQEDPSKRLSRKEKSMNTSTGHPVTHTVTKRGELEWEGLSLNDRMKIKYGKVCKMTRERILKDHWRKNFNDKEDDNKENSEDPEECGEDKANIVMGVIYDKLNNDWFNGTSDDEDDLDGILDYLKPSSYDGFIDLDNEAYNERRCRLFGLTYVEPPLILIEKVKVTRYTIGPEEICTKVKVLGIDEMARTRDNVVSIRAKLMEKIAKEMAIQRHSLVLSLT
ncbi:hypothetical protein Tco_1535732 [Tanacetum coccineum]